MNTYENNCEHATLIRLTWGDFPEITATDIETQHEQAKKKHDWLVANGFTDEHFCNWLLARRGPAKNWLYTVRFRDIQEYLTEYPRRTAP